MAEIEAASAASATCGIGTTSDVRGGEELEARSACCWDGERTCVMLC